MTLGTYVNYVLPLMVLGFAITVLGLSIVVRRLRASRRTGRTRAMVDNSGLLPRRRV